MKILITGGAGFIASHIADRFIEARHDVVILDDLSTGQRENINSAAEFIEGDINDTKLVRALFHEHRFDVVNHHAAQMDVRYSVENPAFDAQCNIIGTVNLLQNCVKVGVNRFMFASTGGAVYGEQEIFPATEDHPTWPVSPYGISKLASEKYLFYYQQTFGLQSIIMRYANIYGPRQNPHGEAGVVAIFSQKIAQGGTPLVNGDGLQTRDYVYVSDVVDANMAALEYDGSITFNVGTGIETDVMTLFHHLVRVSGKDVPEKHGPPKSGEQRRSVISPAKARDTLGWFPRVKVEEGLALTYTSFDTENT